MTGRSGVHAGHLGEFKTCNHNDCVAHKRRYAKRWRYDVANGRHRLTDATPVRRHLDTLTGASWSARAIAGAAQTSATVVLRIRDGQQSRVTTAVAERILAIDPSAIPHRPSTQTTEPFVPRVGTNRRIQALLTMGWTHDEMRRRSGIRTAPLLHQPGRWVTRSTHDAIAQLFNDLAMRPGPSTRTAQRARARGYVGPLGWDDIDKDITPAQVEDTFVEKRRELVDAIGIDEVVILRRIDGDRTVPLSLGERREVVRRAHALGWTDRHISEITGIERSHVGDDRARLGLAPNPDPTAHIVPATGGRRKAS